MKKAFTFIEILVVLGIVSFTLPALFAIIFTIFQQESRIYALKDVKQQGDYAMENIKFTVQQRAARVVDNSYSFDICPVLTSPTPSPAARINFKDTNENAFTYYVNNDNKIASESSTGAISYLTNARVSILNLRFTCYKSNFFSPPIVMASFIASNSASNVSLPFQTSFKLRAY